MTNQWSLSPFQGMNAPVYIKLDLVTTYFGCKHGALLSWLGLLEIAAFSGLSNLFATRKLEA